jgi:hypothetical protein
MDLWRWKKYEQCSAIYVRQLYSKIACTVTVMHGDLNYRECIWPSNR